MLNQNSYFRDLLSVLQIMLGIMNCDISAGFPLNEKEIHPDKSISLCGIPAKTGLWH